MDVHKLFALCTCNKYDDSRRVMVCYRVVAQTVPEDPSGAAR